MNATYEVTTTEMAPNGFACGICDRRILPGQPFDSRPASIGEHGEITELLVCVYCPGGDR